MPTRPLHPCAEPGCPMLTQRSRCPAHVRPRVYVPSHPRPALRKQDYDAKWQEIRARKLEEDPWCETPRCGVLATEVDHILPLAMGGTSAWENLMSMCKPCHSRKTARHDGGFGNRRR